MADLSDDTAQALLNAIKDRTEGDWKHTPEALKQLAEAYSLVRTSMPKRPGRIGTVN